MTQYFNILIRFNTKWQDDELKRQWRVVIEGKERLADKVNISVPCETHEEPINGEQKFHFKCFGRIKWFKDNAIIS